MAWCGFSPLRIFGRKHEQVAVDPVADERFLAVDDDVVPVGHPLWCAWQRGRTPRWALVMPTAVTISPETHPPAGLLVLEFLGGVRRDVRDHDVRVERRGEPAAVGPGQLFDQDDRVEEIRSIPPQYSTAARSFRGTPVRPSFSRRIWGRCPLLHHSSHVGNDFLFEEFPERVPKDPGAPRCRTKYPSRSISHLFRPVFRTGYAFENGFALLTLDAAPRCRCCRRSAREIRPGCASVRSGGCPVAVRPRGP